MKRLPSTLALTLLLVAGPVLGQAIDLGPGVSGYTRFLVYPHLQKGFEARNVIRDREGLTGGEHIQRVFGDVNGDNFTI